VFVLSVSGARGALHHSTAMERPREDARPRTGGTARVQASPNTEPQYAAATAMRVNMPPSAHFSMRAATSAREILVPLGTAGPGTVR
jgi:hypothetical protein